MLPHRYLFEPNISDAIWPEKKAHPVLNPGLAHRAQFLNLLNNESWNEVQGQEARDIENGVPINLLVSYHQAPSG